MAPEHPHAEIPGAEPGERRLLAPLERLLAIDATDLRAALDAATQLLVETLSADKVDALLYDWAIGSLVALGTSDTPMSHKQRALGMDRLQLANDGSAARVFHTGVPHRTGHADQDPGELPGVVEGLGVRSVITVPLEVAGERRGVRSRRRLGRTSSARTTCASSARWPAGSAFRPTGPSSSSASPRRRPRAAGASRRRS